MEAGWYVRYSSGDVEGPLSLAMLKARARENTIGQKTAVKNGADGEWTSADTFPWLFPGQILESDIAQWVQPDLPQQPPQPLELSADINPIPPPLIVVSRSQPHPLSFAFRSKVMIPVAMAVAIIIGVYAHTESKRKAANENLRQAISGVSEWTCSGRLEDADTIEQRLQQAMANPRAIQTTDVAPTLAQFTKVKAQRLAAEKKAQRLAKEATQLLHDSEQAIKDRDFGTARSCLKDYLENPKATLGDKAKATLRELELAISKDDAVSTLQAMSDAGIEQLLRTGRCNDSRFQQPELIKVRTETLRHWASTVVQERDAQRKKEREALLQEATMAAANAAKLAAEKEEQARAAMAKREQEQQEAAAIQARRKAEEAAAEAKRMQEKADAALSPQERLAKQRAANLAAPLEPLDANGFRVWTTASGIAAKAKLTKFAAVRVSFRVGVYSRSLSFINGPQWYTEDLYRLMRNFVGIDVRVLAIEAKEKGEGGISLTFVDTLAVLQKPNGEDSYLPMLAFRGAAPRAEDFSLDAKAALEELDKFLLQHPLRETDGGHLNSIWMNSKYCYVLKYIDCWQYLSSTPPPDWPKR